MADWIADAERLGLLAPAQAGEARRAEGDARAVAAGLVRRDVLTGYQANLLLAGRGAELLLGPHVLLSKLGEGGMGAVFLARHARLGRDVALKVIRKERLHDPSAVRRFKREIEAAARLSHPNIVPVLDAGQAGDAHFLVMDHVAGESLSERVRRSGPMPLADALSVFRQCCAALRHAHERGLVHRDLKPANILLAPDGAARLLDFGLARLAGHDDSLTSLTVEGAIMGTPDFMAPSRPRSRARPTSGPTSTRWAARCTSCSPGSRRSPAARWRRRCAGTSRRSRPRWPACLRPPRRCCRASCGSGPRTGSPPPPRPSPSSTPRRRPRSSARRPRPRSPGAIGGSRSPSPS
ncbi:MAG: serine/threonine protein kinase [Gemmataceae bacterium]|nr:serine/threonine protein kinase [Gemmataceae bacterium]